ncbi:hypothetical protein NXW75_27365 [Bacteroides xylanisolvens]|nr:hypothetical protein [Bacteroides xylanisolvens]
MKNKQNVAWSTFRYFVLGIFAMSIGCSLARSAGCCRPFLTFGRQPDYFQLSFTYPDVQDGICGQPTVVAEVEETAAHLS